MRFGLSSASEASGDENTPPLRDLRTMAVRAGLTTSSAAGSATTNAPKTLLPPTPSSSGLDTRTRALAASEGPASSNLFKHGNGVASSSKDRLDGIDAYREPVRISSTTRSAHRKKTKMLPPWIKYTLPSSSDGDGAAIPTRVVHEDSSDDDDDDKEEQEEAEYQRRRMLRKSSGRLWPFTRPKDRRSSRGIRSSSPSLSSSGFSGSSPQRTSPSDDGEDGADPLGCDLETSDWEELERSRGLGQIGMGEGVKSSTPRRSTITIQEREILQSIAIAGEEDQWDETWGDVLRKSSPRWRDIVSRPHGDRRSASASLLLTSPPAAAAARSADVDLDEVEPTLSRLQLEKEESERKVRADFEARERKLWSSIEDAIRAAEIEASRRAKEEADRLTAARQAQDEAKKRVKAAKEAEECKIKEKAQEREKAKAAEEERRKQQEEDDRKLAEAKKLKEAMASMGGGETLMITARQDHTMWIARMKHIKKKVLPVVSENAQWRKQCFAAKRQITPKIGQLTNSRQEISRITTALSTLLRDAKAAPCPDEEIYIWVLNHLTKCLIRQAEQEVAVKFDTAYPLARVVIWLLLDGHAELGNVLMARLVKKSCWCLGYVPAKTAEQDDAAYSKAVGRASPDETSVQFVTRQSGILAFYFAICQTAPVTPTGVGAEVSLVPAHLRMVALWTWQARCVTPPMTRHAIVPSLWATLIEVAGDRVLTTYGRQASKVWTLLYQQGIMAARAEFVKLEDGKAASGRLQLLLEDWKARGGRAQALKGREMEA